MSTLRVANVHFDSTQTNFIDARTPGTIRINTTNLELNATSVIQNGISLTAPVTPAGALLEYPWKDGDPNPTGYLRLDGNTYLRSAYSNLSSVIGSPIRLGNYTRLLQNTSLQLSDVFQANGVLFHAGTNAVSSEINSFTYNHDLPSAANTIVYSRNGGISWISAAAMGFHGINRYGGGNGLANRSLVAANGTGTYIITNGSATKGDNSGRQIGNAYIMVATSENLNSWSKVVLTTGSAGGAPAGGLDGADGGSSASAVTFGGTQNRFALLFTGGSNSQSGLNCTTNVSDKSHRIAWSNNGTTWTFSSPGSPGYIYGYQEVNSIPQNAQRESGVWINIEATSNGFVAIRSSANARVNTVFTSADGIVWTDISQTLFNAGASSGFLSLSVANGLFILTPSGTFGLPTIDGIPSLFVSNNRTTWSRVNTVSTVNEANPYISGRRIFHNGTFYYTSDNNYLMYSTDLIKWSAIRASNFDNFNIIATANVGNTLYGHGAANTTVTTNARMSITSVNHNTYNVATEFPLPTGLRYSGTYTFPSTFITENPSLNFTSFIKT